MSASPLRFRAPAKLNLYLRVLSPRPDGYHEIETLFERIDLADELAFESQPRGITLTCADLSAGPGTAPALSARSERTEAGGGTTAQSRATLSCGDDNLIAQAARLLQQTTGATRGARIHLIKRIPIAAGLGGGSSDAATTLVGLNALWGLGLQPPALAELAARLGSDVPCFLSPAPFVIGRGRGERCEPLDLPRLRRGALGANGEPVEPEPVDVERRLAHVLVVPDAELATREIYARSRFDLTASKPSLTMVLHALSNGPALAGLADGLWNDLEPEAIRRCPDISLIQRHLRDLGCLAARVSGSGPAVYGLCRDEAHARQVAEALGARIPQAWRREIVLTDRPSLVSTPAVSG